MPCGAKLPVISLFAGAFFGESRWVGVTMYFVGILIILLCALLINALNGYRPRKSFFIMELPEYKIPSIKKAALSMCQRGWSYIVKAGTVILVCNFVVQLMQSFGWNLQPADASASILATVATPFAYLFAPLVGVVAWQLAAAAITGFIAKENVVGTLAVCFVGLENLIDSDAIVEGAGTEVAGILAITKVAALAYLMFNLFSPPCFAAIGAMNSEIKDKKWLFAGVGIQFAVGYNIAFITYFFGTLISGAGFADVWMPIVGWIIALLTVVIFAYAILRARARVKMQKSRKETVEV
jgi:ferrous iron transport protein B